MAGTYFRRPRSAVWNLAVSGLLDRDDKVSRVVRTKLILDR